LKRTPVKDIVILGSGTHCPWFGNVELSDRAWRSISSKLAYVTVTLKRGMYPLASEDSTEVIDCTPPDREQLEGEQYEKVELESE
jgi:hypothetical protein